MSEEGIEIYGYTEGVKAPHAATRSLERYGIELSNDDLRAMSEICQGNSWARDYQKPLGYGKHHIHVSYKDIWFNCVYSIVMCSLGWHMVVPVSAVIVSTTI